MSLNPRVGNNQQSVSVGYATQLAQQTQQRTQALFQDVSRLEQAINQLVQQTSSLNQQIDNTASQGNSASGGVNQPSHYVPVGGNQSDSDELDLEEHDYDSLDGELNHNNAGENVNDQQDTGSGGANYSQDD